MRKGVTMVDPERTYVDATVDLAPDVTLFPDTILQGRCIVGAGAELGPNTRLVDCIVGAGSVVENTVGRDAEVGACTSCQVERTSRSPRRSPSGWG